MSAVANAIGIARPHLSAPRRGGRQQYPLVFRRAENRRRQWREEPAGEGRGAHRPFDRLRTGVTLDCCDREAVGHAAITGDITAEDVQDLMVPTVERRYGR